MSLRKETVWYLFFYFYNFIMGFRDLKDNKAMIDFELPVLICVHLDCIHFVSIL